MKYSSFTLILGVALALGLAMESCQKDPLNHLSSADSRIYITDRDSTTEFNSFRTFSVVDSVDVMNNTQGASLQRTPEDSILIQEVIRQMQARGYIYVSREQHPDLGINITLVSNQYLNLVSYPYSWWVYPGYWDPYYWGFAGYSYYFPPSFALYQTREDMLVLDMLDLRDAGSGQQLKAVWDGKIRGEAVLDASNYPEEVQALFQQSPYLQSGIK